MTHVSASSVLIYIAIVATVTVAIILVESTRFISSDGKSISKGFLRYTRTVRYDEIVGANARYDAYGGCAITIQVAGARFSFVLPIDDLEGTDIQQSVIATLRLASSNGASISPSIFERRTVSV